MGSFSQTLLWLFVSGWLFFEAVASERYLYGSVYQCLKACLDNLVDSFVEENLEKYLDCLQVLKSCVLDLLH